MDMILLKCFLKNIHLIPQDQIVQLTLSTVEPRYNEVLGTMKINILLYQVSHYISPGKKTKSWDQQNYLVMIRGFCYNLTYL